MDRTQLSSNDITAMIALVFFVAILLVYSRQIERFIDGLAGIILCERMTRDDRTYRFVYRRGRDRSIQITVKYRPKNMHTARIANVHLLPGELICTTQPIMTIEKAQAIARYWVNGYEHCFAYGNFPDNGAKVQV
jgi:hypothetical protein